MKRERLAELLDADGGEAAVACAKALREGADHRVYADPIPAGTLAATYARRQRFLTGFGLGSIGFAEAVAALEARPADAGVLLGRVADEPPGYSYLAFLDAEGEAVIACLALESPGDDA